MQWKPSTPIFGRLGAVIGAVHASGNLKRRPGSGAGRSCNTPGSVTGRDAAQAATRQAILELLKPDQAESWPWWRGGLGLAIVRGLLEAHGGRVAVRNADFGY